MGRSEGYVKRVEMAVLEKPMNVGNEERRRIRGSWGF